MPDWTKKLVLNDGPTHVHTPGSVIELKPDKEGAIDIFRVTGTGLDPAWKDSWLLPRGSTEFQWREKPLREWDPTLEDVYDERISRALRHADADTVRLEGEIVVAGKKELVVFMIADNAVRKNDGTMDKIVLIRCRMKSLFDLVLSQDGTAHGNPR